MSDTTARHPITLKRIVRSSKEWEAGRDDPRRGLSRGLKLGGTPHSFAG